MHEIFEYIKREWDVLTKAPLTFIGLALLSFSAGVGVGLWHYSERLNEKDGQVGRYRVALGIDPASKGALVELNNQELALKAQSTVAELRKLGARLDARFAEINKQENAKKMNHEQAMKAKDAFIEEGLRASQDFHANLASDMYNLRNELRRRLDPAAIAHIPSYPFFNMVDGSRLYVDQIVRDMRLDYFLIPKLADEIEQMTKLLPPD